jgi:alpha-N-acetylgalactosaminidase
MNSAQIIVGNTELSIDQAKVQMSVWSIWSAPLIMSNDLRTIMPEYRDILLNKKVIAIDQDPLGMFGKVVYKVSVEIDQNNWQKLDYI